MLYWLHDFLPIFVKGGDDYDHYSYLSDVVCIACCALSTIGLSFMKHIRSRVCFSFAIVERAPAGVLFVFRGEFPNMSKTEKSQ